MLKVKKLKAEEMEPKQLKVKILKKKELKVKELAGTKTHGGKGLKIISCSDCGKNMEVGKEAKAGRCRKCTQALISGVS